jgi:hypothetical protein
MFFNDLLDSVKTAHPQGYVNEWWRPESSEVQKTSIELARASIMARILYGETILLSNNQAVDSVAWLRSASEFTSLKTPWAPVAVSFYGCGMSPKEDCLRKLLIEYLVNPKIQPSAWVGLDEKAIKTIKRSLNRYDSPRFDKMLYPIKSSISSHLFSLLHNQAIELQAFFEYLTENSHKKVCIKANEAPNSYIWRRLNDRTGMKHGISGLAINELKNKLSNDDYEKRSELYKALGDLDDTDRIVTRKYIDRFYNEKLGISVNGGRGCFTLDDHGLSTSSETIGKMDILADKDNNPIDLLSQDLLRIELGPIKCFLDMDDLRGLVRETEFIDSVSRLQHFFGEYQELRRKSRFNIANVRDWRRRANNEMHNHHALLARLFNKKIEQISEDSMTLFVKAGGDTLIKILIVSAMGQILNQTFGVELLELPKTMLVSFLALKAKDYYASKARPIIACGRTRLALSRAVKIKSERKLLR